MAARTFLHLGDTANRCISTTVQYYKPKLHTLEAYKQIRSFRKLRNGENKVDTTLQKLHIEKGPVHLSKLWRPFCFTVAFSGTTFVAAAICEYERVRATTYRLINRYWQDRVHRTGWRYEMQMWWNNLREGQKIFVPICFLNVLVFLGWRVPALQKTMLRYFTSNPASSVLCMPMLFSTFSHHSFLHLAANMYVLHSFSSLAVEALGREQFVAFYLSSGVVSSFASLLYKTALGLQGPSLGASGAIMGVLGYVCTQFPGTYLTIIFLPMYAFTAATALKAVMGLDLAGCIFRLQYFDHAAHLGGALCGIFWQAWGNLYLWQKRQPLLTAWHELRGPSRPH